MAIKEADKKSHFIALSYEEDETFRNSLSLADYQLVEDSFRTALRVVVCNSFETDELNELCCSAVSANNANAIAFPFWDREYNAVPAEQLAVLDSCVRELSQPDKPLLKLIAYSRSKPDWTVISRKFKELPFTAHGLLIDWAEEQSTVSELQLNDAFLREHRDLKIYYLYEGQRCDNSGGRLDGFFAGLAESRCQAPEGIIPVFGCYGSNEGYCYNAHRFNSEIACGSDSHFAYIPADLASEFQLFYRFDSCRGYANTFWLLN